VTNVGMRRWFGCAVASAIGTSVGTVTYFLHVETIATAAEGVVQRSMPLSQRHPFVAPSVALLAAVVALSLAILGWKRDRVRRATWALLTLVSFVLFVSAVGSLGLASIAGSSPASSAHKVHLFGSARR
jgi:hypothetical protein